MRPGRSGTGLSRRLVFKLKATVLRFSDSLILLPRRLFRVGDHLRKGLTGWDDDVLREGQLARLSADFAFWWIELGFLILDLFGLAELYESFMEFAKFNSRPLSPGEEAVARDVFGGSICYRRVRLDERAFLGPLQMAVCYVSGFHINSWGVMSDALLIHELVHVWQYQQLGLRYVPLALRAQFFGGGYDYGGAAALLAVCRAGGGLKDFNLEQQAEIIADHFRIGCGRRPVWSGEEGGDPSVYRYYAGQLRALGRKDKKITG